MNNNLTELVFILDKSGSMNPLTNDTIGGFNTMIEQQKNECGEAYVTTILFDNHYTVLHDHINVKNVPEMTSADYIPFGCTALLDAVGNAINTVGQRLSETPEHERPGKVIFVITTDGKENASCEFTKTKIKEMIELQQNVYSWTFMFLGANIDAASEAAALGINSQFSKTYTASSAGTDSLYSAVSTAIQYARSSTCETNDWGVEAAACLQTII